MEKQLEFKNEETDSVNLFESKIISMIFNYETSRIEFIIDWTEGDHVRIFFEECRDLIINLEHHTDFDDNLLGALEITGFSYKRLNDGYIIQFNFDFNLTGKVKFKCMDFTFYTPSVPMQNGGNDNLI